MVGSTDHEGNKTHNPSQFVLNTHVRGHSLRKGSEGGRGVGKISKYSYLGEGGQTHSYVIFSKSLFYIRNCAVKWFGRDHISFASGR
jgi:hypothetical protein